jgi:hypothetical protein
MKRFGLDYLHHATSVDDESLIQPDENRAHSVALKSGVRATVEDPLLSELQLRF